MFKKAILNNMGKAPSFYDWEFRFRSNPKSKRKSHNKKKKRKEKLTSIGINEEDLRYFLKDWRMDNLPVKKRKLKFG